jgi:diguanylate cyclase (GGDEF)-like protein/PAS domain S-box-containing protein
MLNVIFYKKTFKYILFATCFIAILYPLINIYFIFPSFSKVLIKHTEDESVRVATNLSLLIISADKELKNPDDFSNVLKKAAYDYKLKKLRVFSEQGEIIYSSDSKDIGETNNNSYFHEIVAKGNIYTKHVEKGTKTLEGQTINSNVVETYVPIMVKTNFIGAIEIYYDITSESQALNNVVLRLFLISFSLLLFFLIVITIILLKADRSAIELQPDKLPALYHSPLYLLSFIVISIFVVEAITMFFLSLLPRMSMLIVALLDSSLLVMLLSPLLYFFILHPLILHINKRIQAEEDLRKSHDKLEEQVENRTTKLVNKNKLLQESESRYRSLVESTDNSIYLVDKNYKYLFINKKHLKRMGLSSKQIIGKSYADFHSVEGTKKFMEKIDKCFKTGQSAQNEYKSRRDGNHFLQTFSPVKGKDNNVIAVTIVSKDINKLKLMEEKLRTASLTDELTGLYNRRGFFILAKQQLKLANRGSKRVYIICADFDFLKIINDNLGHRIGDLALKETANILKETFRKSDIIARIGGDEFAILATELETDIEVLIARLKAVLDARNAEVDKVYELSLSVGFSRYEYNNPSSIDDLLAEADKSMYAEKQQKR